MSNVFISKLLSLTLAACLSLGIYSFAAAENTIQWVDGAVSTATIESVSSNGVITGDGVPSNSTLEKIVGYQRELTNQAPGTVEVLIAGQSKLFTNSIEIQGATANIASTSGIAMQVPLNVIQAIIFKRTQRVDKQIAERSESADMVIVDTPDGEKVVGGIFEGMKQGKLGLNFNGKSRKIGLEKVNAVALADLGLKIVGGTQLELSDGSSINGRIKRIEAGVVTFAITPNHSLEIPWAAVSRLEVQSDNLVYLSTLNPLSVQQQTIFAPQRTWQRDRSVESNPIRFGATENSSPQTFRKGIGTHSYCNLDFANTNQFQRFQAIAGIDAETNGRGDCQMSVYADGIKLWSRRITGQTPPEVVDLDITAMAKVTLIVEPGEQFDLADHANWADAKFVKP